MGHVSRPCTASGLNIELYILVSHVMLIFIDVKNVADYKNTNNL
jgi:hypothetical protein